VSASLPFTSAALRTGHATRAARTARAPRRGQVHRRVGLAMAVALLALGSWALTHDDPLSTAAASTQAAAEATPTPAAHWPAAAAPAAAAAPRTQATRLTALNISLEDGEIHIDARGASRQNAALALAALTHAELQSAPGALADAPPLTLRWRGRDASQAWQAVLGADTNHALQCQGTRCRVWLAASPHTTAPAAAPISGARQTARHASDVQTTARPLVEWPAPLSPTFPVMQPDPPGLFPSE
jgi:cytochrome oxidase assembly protein ShyY1